MPTYHMLGILGLCFMLAMAGLIFPLSSAQAADQKPATIVPPVRPAAVASGAVEDTITICLARIPQVSTPGQRLMAEQSCQRDESGRSLMGAVPGR